MIDANRIVSSKVTGMNIGQLMYGLPAMRSGYAIDDTHTWRPNPLRPPTIPPSSTNSGTRRSSHCIASNSSWIGYGENESRRR